jgi:hypothetical protein
MLYLPISFSFYVTVIGQESRILQKFLRVSYATVKEENW